MPELKPLKPPRGLFDRIIKRLGLEQQLHIVRRHLGFFTGALAVFSVLSIFAFVGLKEVLKHSSFGPFISLIFTDPGMVLKYWHSYTLLVLESVPGADALGFLAAIGFLLLFLKFASRYFEKLSSINKIIKKYGHK